jgi:hypothetical protein
LSIDFPDFSRTSRMYFEIYITATPNTFLCPGLF